MSMYLRWAKEVSLLVVWVAALFCLMEAGAAETWTDQRSPSTDAFGTLARQTDLIATPAAPTGARGMVELGAVTLSLEIERLTPGLYQLGVVKKADGAWVPVGVIAVSNPTLGP
ncbi:MAG TPA: hypothetical protein VNT26_05970, partial [Candidatus Sulfotelmatobacter sp.]|nr:hypothetical protein [Candidatus Sulfotelmatobacter sp.]